MGGFFNPPKPKSVQTTPVVEPLAVATPTTAVVPAQEDAARKERVASLQRQARGRAGTIATSPRGLLTLSPSEPMRKSLLGE